MDKWWGYELLMDCASGYLPKVRDGENIKAFAKELVKAIDMVPYGEPQVQLFGEDNKKGHTLVQLIETSNISAHFCDSNGDIYLNVFSCKKFSPKVVEQVVNKYFSPIRIRSNLITRQA